MLEPGVLGAWIYVKCRAQLSYAPKPLHGRSVKDSEFVLPKADVPVNRIPYFFVSFHEDFARRF
jgi:hypothetical protein